MKKNNILPLVSVLTLIGCDSGSWRRQDDLMTRGWAEAPEAFTPPQVYCYKTLDKVECFREPLESESARLEGYYAHNHGALPESMELSEQNQQSTIPSRKKKNLSYHHRQKKVTKQKSTQASKNTTKKKTLEKDSSGLKGQSNAEGISLKGEEHYQRRRYMTKIVQE